MRFYFSIVSKIHTFEHSVFFLHRKFMLQVMNLVSKYAI